MKIFIDPMRLKQILINLLINAVKFTNKGCIIFEVSLSTKEKITKEEVPSSIVLPNDPSMLQQIITFSIQDTGIGIKPENIKSLFLFYSKEKAKQNSSNSEFNIHGCGLGLLISHELLKKMKQNEKELNYISVKSELNTGSTFTFSILANEIINDTDEGKKIISDQLKIKETYKFFPTTTNSIIQASTTTPSKKEKKIEEMIVLAVDDDPFCVDVVVKLLKKINIQNIYTANNGAESIEVITQNLQKEIYFDAIVMDCNMPVMNGFEASRKIITMMKNKEIHYLEIIGLTANVATADETICREAGMAHYLTKPVKKTNFEKTINDVLTNINKE